MDLSLVIPCYNESDNVPVIVTELLPIVDQLRRSQSVEIVFVDDGSDDGTGDLLESRLSHDPEVRVVRHDRNRGLGAALRTGFQHARGNVVVTTDSDATYPFALIVPLLDLLQPGVDLVTASCYHPDGGVENVPGYRIFLSKGASFLYRVLVSRSIHTYTCLFRAYRRPVIENVPFSSDGFLSVTELLANAVARGYTVAELPCTLHMRRYGASKAKIARTILAHLRFQWQLARSRRRVELSRSSAAR